MEVPVLLLLLKTPHLLSLPTMETPALLPPIAEILTLHMLKTLRPCTLLMEALNSIHPLDMKNPTHPPTKAHQVLPLFRTVPQLLLPPHPPQAVLSCILAVRLLLLQAVRRLTTRPRPGVPLLVSPWKTRLRKAGGRIRPKAPMPGLCQQKALTPASSPPTNLILTANPPKKHMLVRSHPLKPMPVLSYPMKHMPAPSHPMKHMPAPSHPRKHMPAPSHLTKAMPVLSHPTKPMPNPSRRPPPAPDLHTGPRPGLDHQWLSTVFPRPRYIQLVLWHRPGRPHQPPTTVASPLIIL
jgi:hypothetical protein